MSTGKAKVPMEGTGQPEHHQWGAAEAAAIPTAGTIPAPEPSFELKGNPFASQDVSTNGNSAPTHVPHPSHK